MIKNLRDLSEAEEYLNAALEKNDPELFLLALRNVAEAQGGVAQLAEKTKLNRESLYKMLSERGNPELRSLDALLPCTGVPARRGQFSLTSSTPPAVERLSTKVTQRQIAPFTTDGQ